MDVERSRRFQRFIKQQVEAFAQMAEYGFASRGPGAVFLIVDTLQGGEEFRPQAKLSLNYTPASDVQSDEALADVIRRCNFPQEAVVVAMYRDGTREINRVELQKMREALGGKQGQWTPDPGTRK